MKMRANGDSIALLYHATGTGKTVRAVEDAKSVGEENFIYCTYKRAYNTRLRRNLIYFGKI